MADKSQGGAEFVDPDAMRGSQWVNEYVERPMTGYLLNNSDLRVLFAFNVVATALFSLGGLAAGAAISQFIEWSTKKTPGSYPIAITLTIVAGVFYIIGAVLAFINGTSIRTIKRESIIRRRPSPG